MYSFVTNVHVYTSVSYSKKICLADYGDLYDSGRVINVDYTLYLVLVRYVHTT